MKHAYILFYIVLLSTVFSCKKEPPSTIIEGEVIDSKSGARVPHATISAVCCKLNKIGLCENVYINILTDSNGFFSHTLPTDIESGGLLNIIADNYLLKEIVDLRYQWKRGEKPYFTIPLVKSDCALNILVKNETGQHDFIKIVINNPTVISEAHGTPSQYTLLNDNIPIGAEKHYFFPLISNEYTKIFWGFNDFNLMDIQPDFQDSVFFHPNDTIDYLLSF